MQDILLPYALSSIGTNELFLMIMSAISRKPRLLYSLLVTANKEKGKYCFIQQAICAYVQLLQRYFFQSCMNKETCFTYFMVAHYLKILPYILSEEGFFRLTDEKYTRTILCVLYQPLHFYRPMIS